MDEPAAPLSAVLRKSLLLCARDLSSVQDQADCAELLLAAGLADSARLLYDVVFIRRGFSPPRMEDQAGTAARTRLWGEVGWARPGRLSAPRPDDAISTAIVQLRCIFASASGMDGHENNVAEQASRAAGDEQAVSGLIPADLAELCEQLCDALRQPAAVQAWQDAGKSLSRLHAAVLSRPSFGLSSHVDAKPSLLAAGLAFDSLRYFLVSNYDLAAGPFGSSALFHAAARLESAGLGPYFTNTAQLIRDGRDMFGLIQLAAGNEPGAALEAGMLDRWSVLLSQHFHDSVLHEWVDELADLGLMRAVWGIFERAARQASIRRDAGLLWRIRDAGLDNGDFELALRAQRLVVDWQPYTGIEWVVLGEIEATVGHRAQAEEAFVKGLGIDPGNQDGWERLEALREGQFDMFEVVGGFGTSSGRRLARLQRQRIGTGLPDRADSGSAD